MEPIHQDQMESIYFKKLVRSIIKNNNCTIYFVKESYKLVYTEILRVQEPIF